MGAAVDTTIWHERTNARVGMRMLQTGEVEVGSSQVASTFSSYSTFSATDSGSLSAMFCHAAMRTTVHADIVRLNMCLFHLAIFNDQSVSLTAVSTKYSSAVERQVQSPRKGKRGIGNEANLAVSVYWSGGIGSGSSACRWPDRMLQSTRVLMGGGTLDIHRFCLRDQGWRPMLSFYKCISSCHSVEETIVSTLTRTDH